jgi:hypothetical protein
VEAPAVVAQAAPPTIWRTGIRGSRGARDPRNDHAAPEVVASINTMIAIGLEPNSSGSCAALDSHTPQPQVRNPKQVPVLPAAGPVRKRGVPYIRAFIWCSAHVAVVVVTKRKDVTLSHLLPVGKASSLGMYAHCR